MFIGVRLQMVIKVLTGYSLSQSPIEQKEA